MQGCGLQEIERLGVAPAVLDGKGELTRLAATRLRHGRVRAIHLANPSDNSPRAGIWRAAIKVRREKR
jgi:hypothetical protein